MKRCKPFVFLFVALPICLGGVLLFNTSRAAIETPAYKVVRADGKFEIRDYPALSVVTTTLEGVGMNGGFRKLFGFITGDNEAKKKIEMTSPVLIDSAKDKRTMSFIMPKKAVETGVPKPAGENVTLGKVDAGRYAVLRFGGGRTTKNENAAIVKLKTWLDAQKLTGRGDPLFAYYDPPWTPIFLRRNEVLVRI